MKWFGCLLVPFLATKVFSASLNSNDPLVGTKAPPAVAGVSGDENLEPKHKQMIRKLVNGAKDEERPYLEAEKRMRPVNQDRWSSYGKGTEWCTADRRELLEWFTDITLQRCQGLCLDQNGPKCKAVEYWSGGIRACFQCTDLSKVEPYTDTNDWAYPVHVWVRD